MGGLWGNGGTKAKSGLVSNYYPVPPLTLCTRLVERDLVMSIGEQCRTTNIASAAALKFIGSA